MKNYPFYMYISKILLKLGPAKWRFTVSGEFRFMTSNLESWDFLMIAPLNYPNYIENQV